MRNRITGPLVAAAAMLAVGVESSAPRREPKRVRRAAPPRKPPYVARAHPRLPKTDAEYLAMCCNRAWNEYGRYQRREINGKREPMSPAAYFGGPPPRGFINVELIKLTSGASDAS